MLDSSKELISGTQMTPINLKLVLKINPVFLTLYLKIISRRIIQHFRKARFIYSRLILFLNLDLWIYRVYYCNYLLDYINCAAENASK